MSRQSWNARRLSIEALEHRVVPAVTAVFNPAGGGLLTVTGDDQNNTIAVSRSSSGMLLVNGGAVHVTGGTPTVTNTALIKILGLGGNDTLSLNETNGTLPKAQIFGGAGNDVITGGSGADQLFGEGGNDTLLGKGGNDQLFGGSGNDVLTGGAGDDQVFGQDGNDNMIWNPGDGTDLDEGGGDIDTVTVNGGNGAETFTATANGTRVRFDRTTPGPFSLDIGTSEKLVVNMNGGDDTFTGSNGLAPLISLTVDGGTGNDTIIGGDGADTLIGGDGNDTITGGRGNDVMIGGTGDDVFIWNPGDGSDTAEGQAGFDRLLFNGANVNENMTVSANGTRVRFFRDVGNVTMDLNGVEGLTVAALGGADTLTVNDLRGTALTDVLFQLGNDGAADNVIVNGTNGDDFVQAFSDANGLTVTGLAATVRITGAEAANDTLTINALDGDDFVDVSQVPAGQPPVVVHGGAGDDILIGGAGTNSLFGDDGDDVLIGGAGSTKDGGAGTNVLL